MEVEMSLTKKTILVTGGSGGIGSAIIKLLSEKGANIIFTYRNNKEEAEKIIESYKGQENEVTAYGIDIKETKQVKKLIDIIMKKHNKIDVIINNAGIKRDKSILYMKKSDWDEVINTNLTGTFNVVNAAIPYLLKQRKGRIINLGSISGISGLAGQTNYSSSKAGIIGFTKSLAKEIAPFNISVNTIAPGPVQTEMVKGLSKDRFNELLANVPMKRVCSPEEVAMMVNVLADEELSPGYLTGQVIALDGGMGS